MEMIFPANLLTGAKQPKSANHPKVNTFCGLLVYQIDNQKQPKHQPKNY